MEALLYHEELFNELTAVLKKYAEKYSIPAEELLAICANMTGKVIAFQDQQVVTAERAMLIVAKNIELGNQQAISAVMDVKGKA